MKTFIAKNTGKENWQRELAKITYKGSGQDY